MADKTKTLRGNGHINVSNVNSINSECILLTYTVWNFKTESQIKTIRQKIYDLVEGELSFELQISDWDGEEEKYKLKAKIKSCQKEAKAHKIKKELDEFIKKIGGQTTLDEELGEGEND